MQSRDHVFRPKRNGLVKTLWTPAFFQFLNMQIQLFYQKLDCCLQILLIWTSLKFHHLLTNSLIHHFETVPNSKKLQTTPKMWLSKDFKNIILLHVKHCKKRWNCSFHNVYLKLLFFNDLSKCVYMEERVNSSIKYKNLNRSELKAL